MLRWAVRRTLHLLGYELRPLGREGWHPVHLHVDGELARFERPRWDPTYIRRLGFSPATLVDVGVAAGTPSLYAAFPEAELVLVDPLVESERLVRPLLERRSGSFHATALGEEEGVRTLHLDPEIARSSLHERAGPERGRDHLERRDVPVTTLDALTDEHGFRPPYGLKVDVEGAEMSVLRGARRFLPNAQFVIAELPLRKRYVDDYDFADVVALLDGFGLHLRDVFDIGRWLPSDEPTFIDAVFAREDRWT